MIAPIGFVGSSVRLRHALAFAADLRRMCVVNQEPAYAAARKLGLDEEQTAGAVRLLRQRPTLSPERAALVAMRDPGLDDADIAEMFGRSKRWAALVREHAAELREVEPIPEDLEYLDAGLQKGDPSPEEIRERALALRMTPSRLRAPESKQSIRTYSWTNNAFISIGAF